MAGRTSQYRKIPVSSVYVDGTAARRLEEVPQQQEQRKPSGVSSSARKNREREKQMNFGYLAFLTLAAVAVVAACTSFIQLRVKGTRLLKQVTALETQVEAARLENDSLYHYIMANVDMEEVRTTAMDRLGMVYPVKSQIVEYSLDDSDYVRQYAEVPEE